MDKDYPNNKFCGIVTSEQDELREFLLVLRRALLMVVSWIEKRYPPTSNPK